MGLIKGTYSLHAQWRAALDGDTAVFAPLLIARRHGQACGAAAIFRRPAGPSGRLVAVEVAAAHRRAGVGSALLRETSRELARAGIARQVAGVWSDRPGAPAFLAANGFRLYEMACAMAWSGAPYAVEVGDIPCLLYEGGDEALDQEIAELQNIGFRGDKLAGPISGDDVRDAIAGYGAWFLTARDPATGKLVGVAECYASGYFCAVVVARKFWGTGLSQRLMAGGMDRFQATGRREIFALVRTANAASLRLLDGLGWWRGTDVPFYAAETGA